jgi:hypothetical protein
MSVVAVTFKHYGLSLPQLGQEGHLEATPDRPICFATLPKERAGGGSIAQGNADLGSEDMRCSVHSDWRRLANPKIINREEVMQVPTRLLA